MVLEELGRQVLYLMLNNEICSDIVYLIRK